MLTLTCDRVWQQELRGRSPFNTLIAYCVCLRVLVVLFGGWGLHAGVCLMSVRYRMSVSVQVLTPV